VKLTWNKSTGLLVTLKVKASLCLIGSR